MHNLPSGTVTFLFTDIEGSTRLLRDLGDAYATVLADHRRLMRAAFAEAGGQEVDTQGDAFFVVFPRARDAAAAAVSAQRALFGHHWPRDASVRVRMGLHTGEPLRAANGYVGLDVHRAARIAAAAWGGQVIVSQTTRELIADDLPEGLRLRYLGEHRLKDLTTPQDLYQVVADDLPGEFPPPRSLDTLPNNLPVQLTRLIGRERELAEIDRLLENPDCRLLTLVGPGGIGKTRLALHAAGRRLEKYAQGIYFIPLTPVASPEFLVPTMAATLQFPIDTHSSIQDPKSQLLDFLGRQSMLLVVDNFEHVIQGAPLLDELLEGARGIKLLVTSRERLNLRGEWTFDVPGLPYPHNGNGARIEDYAALTLFAERARQVDPEFSLSAEERSHATRICQLVEGMPLGIELAAAWASTLSCREIATEVERNIDFLATSLRDVPDKHRSLRAAFDHSWRLLSDAQRAGFSKLAVFRGGFRRDAAAAVAGLDLPTLTDLVGKSLVRRSGQGRYEIHELLRQYAEEKLGELPEEREAVRARHSRYYTALLVERAPALVGSQMKEVREEIRLDLGNVRAAVEWQAANGSDTDARKTFESLGAFFWVQGWHEGVDAFSHIVQMLQSAGRPAEAIPGALLSAQAHQALWASLSGDAVGSDRLVGECLPDLRRVGYAREVAACLCVLGVNRSNEGDYAESISHLEDGLAVTVGLQEPFLDRLIHIWLGWDHFELGHFVEAERQYDRACRLARTSGDMLGLSFALSKLGILADALKDYERARRLHQDALDVFVDLEQKAGEGYCLTRLSFSTRGLGRYEEAVDLGRAGYAAFESLGHPWGMIRARIEVGFAELALHRPGDARRSFGDALARAMEHRLVSNAIYALIGIASVLTREGDHAHAAQIFAFAIHHRSTPSLFRDIAERTLTDLVPRLDPGLLAAVRERGLTTTLEQVVETVRTT
jgi:predicted ATPase/class 3 adenylate cyclase